MSDINTLRKSTESRFIEPVDSSLNAAHFANDLDASSGFYAIEGMSGKKYRFFINTLVKTLGDAAYLEVGSWAGSTLCSAIHGNKVRAVAIDNWSQFGGPRDAFYNNVKTFLTPQVSAHVIEGDFRQVDYSAIGIFDIYLFDGPHEEKDQYDGLSMALPALGNEFVFIVDDWNWHKVRQGTLNAIRDCNLDILYATEIKTTDVGKARDLEKSWHKTDWHNGYYISVLSKRV